MARRILLLDTSYVLALENRNDPHHEHAKSLDRQLMQERDLSLLHWGILLEVLDGYARVDRRGKGLQLLERFETEDRYLVYPITDPLLQQALTLYRSRPDKDWGLTDCLSFVLMRQEGITEALTADVHFRQAGFTALLLESS
jgi:predicted nucleic acid-binding protein